MTCDDLVSSVPFTAEAPATVRPLDVETAGTTTSSTVVSLDTPTAPLVAIGVPSRGEIRIETMLSIVNVLCTTPVRVHFIFLMGTYIHTLRQQTAEAAVALGADYLWFVDSDMRFNPDTLARMLAHRAPIVGLAYNERRPPNRSTVKVFAEDGVSIRGDTTLGELGLTEAPFPVYGLGTGVLLIDTAVFRALPKPWFPLTNPDDEGNFIGEDIGFCIKAREHGFPVLCDPTIAVRHIGTTEF